MLKPVHTFTVVPSLPRAIEGLREIAYNLRWCWSHDSIALFRRLDSDLWETCGHNPVLLLGTIEQEKLEAASRDEAFLAHLDRVASSLKSYLGNTATWFGKIQGEAHKDLLVAYFSAEFGLTECMSIFAGGLGILAGDHLKSASDLSVPLVGVGLLYQQGYFRQYFSQSGWQQEVSVGNDFNNLPLSVAHGLDGTPVVVGVDLPGRKVYAQVWKVSVGRVSLYLLDTNIRLNLHPDDRGITEQLYGGDREMRIRQEMVLGIGGYRALQALRLRPTVYHMNEGHSAFLSLEHVLYLMQVHGLSFSEARELASTSLVFTTHTPVDAGHDYFSCELIDRYFGETARSLGLSLGEFHDLGRVHGAGEFCMTVLALRLASRSNGVSKLHGQVSRKMWQSLWPKVPVNEIPIGHVTNGVHFRSWLSAELNQLYDRYLGPQWRDEPASGETWSRVHSIPAEELWRTHERRRERLVAFARRHVRDQRVLRGAPQAEIEAAAEVLDPDALTIGFARRFATYKRAALILSDLPRLRCMLTDNTRPLQIIFAGKAHPKDDAGKELVRRITEVSRDPELGRRIVFLSDYDMAVARYLVQGVDVWLNTPLRPNEASGTSGMKAAANGVLNLSVPDGWWDEVWNDPQNPRQMGWAIGKGEEYSDRQYQDQVEAQSLYDLLERDVIPTFYDRGPDRIPRKWTDRMKASISSLCPFVNTHRMVRDYTCEYYTDAHQRFRDLEANGGARARELAAALNRIRNEWHNIWISAVEDRPENNVPVASTIRVRAKVHLGRLTPQDVAVDLYIGRVGPNDELMESRAVPLLAEGENAQDTYNYVGETTMARSGLHGFTVRVRPSHPGLTVAFVPGLICWAEEARVSAGVA